MNGRIVADGRTLGAAFLVAPSVVITASHVIGTRGPGEVRFVLDDGPVVEVAEIRRDEVWDIAALMVAGELLGAPLVGEATNGVRWRVDARPDNSDPALTGSVGSGRRLVRNAADAEVELLQLTVEQDLGRFDGYSGAAVTSDGDPPVVMGVVVEQVLERGLSSSPRRAAANVLYAVSITEALQRLRITSARTLPLALLASAWSWPYPAQAPAPPYAFVGRGPMLARLDAVARRGPDGPSLVCIDGMAGVGKTSTVLYWAKRSGALFPDGQLWLDLRGHAPELPPMSTAEALSLLLAQLGVPPDAVPAETEHQTALYRVLTARRRLLVLLDNAANAEQVRALLPQDSGCLAMVTSRERLSGLVANPGALRFSLDVLSVEESVELFAELLGADRARSRKALVELAGLCAHLPLALRVIAALLDGEPGDGLHEMVSRLRADPRLSRFGVPGDPATAVSVAFDRSYERLSPPTQQAFRRWGIVPGPDFTVDVAATLLPQGEAQAADSLDRLNQAHLLERRNSARYLFHDLVRLYALERFEAEERAADRMVTYAALFAHYLDATDGAVRRLAPQVSRLPYAASVDWTDRFPTARAAGAWIDEELANLLAAVRTAGIRGFPQTAWLLTDRLRIYFWSRRRMAEWFDNARVGLAAAQQAGSAEGESAARLSLGQSYSTVSNYDAAIAELQRALAAAREAGWSEGEAASLGILGTVCREAGRLGEAADFYRQARALYRNTGMRGGEAIALANLGAVNWELGRLGESATDSGEALMIFEELDNQDAVCITLNNLAMAKLDADDLAAAEARANRALQIAEEFDSSAGRAQGLDTMALVQVGMRRLDDAARNASTALELAREIGDRRIEISVLNTLGTISLLHGRPEEANDRYREACAKASDTGHVRGQADALIGLALAQSGADVSGAMTEVAAARDLATSFGFALIVGRSLVVEGRLHARLGDKPRAWSCGVAALKALRGTGARAIQLEAVELLGQLCDDADALPPGSGLADAVDELSAITTISAATELRAALIDKLSG